MRIKKFLLASVLILAAFVYCRGGLCTEAVGVYAATDEPTPIPTPAPKVEFLAVVYTGPSIIVGQNFSRDDLVVTAIWDNGEYQDVTDYNLASTRVGQEGYNTFLVTYKGKAETFAVLGKKLADISVMPLRTQYHIGNGPDNRDISVLAAYTDGTTEVISSGFSINPAKFTKPGAQDVRVAYGGFSGTFEVMVEEAYRVVELTAVYNGTLIEGQEVDPEKLDVVAVYEDFATERITTYTIQNKVFSGAGTNTIRVAFQGRLADAEVEIIAKKPVAIRAQYLSSSGGVTVGEEYNESEMFVYVTFTDGKEVRVTDYTVATKIIRYVGENTVKISYEGLITEVNIRGIEYVEPNFDYTSDFVVDCDLGVFVIQTAIPKKMTAESVVGREIKLAKLRPIYRRLYTNGAYFGFGYNFVNNDDETNLPLKIRITLPEGLEPTYLDLYYSSNLRSIMGRMNKEKIDDRTLEITIYKTGYYLAVFDPDRYIEQTEEEEDDMYED